MSESGRKKGTCVGCGEETSLPGRNCRACFFVRMIELFVYTLLAGAAFFLVLYVLTAVLDWLSD